MMYPSLANIWRTNYFVDEDIFVLCLLHVKGRVEVGEGNAARLVSRSRRMMAYMGIIE